MVSFRRQSALVHFRVTDCEGFSRMNNETSAIVECCKAIRMSHSITMSGTPPSRTLTNRGSGCMVCANEEECFSPLLVVTNAARRKLCATFEKLYSLLIGLPKHKIIAISAKEFAETKLCVPAVSRDDWDHKMFSMLDDFTPLKTWEESMAMSVCKHDKNCTKGKASTSPRSVCQHLNRLN